MHIESKSWAKYCKRYWRYKDKNKICYNCSHVSYDLVGKIITEERVKQMNFKNKKYRDGSVHDIKRVNNVSWYYDEELRWK